MRDSSKFKTVLINVFAYSVFFWLDAGTTNGNSPNFTYQFHGDPRATFAQFFGSSNPFASFFDMGDNLFEKNVFDLDTETDFFSPFGGLGSRHGLGGAFRFDYICNDF